MDTTNQRILTINTGSSSLKAALYWLSEPASLRLSVEVSRHGEHGGPRYHAPVISSADSRVKVRVIKANEDLMITRHTSKIIKGEINV